MALDIEEIAKIDWTNWKFTEEAVLIFVEKDDHLLLIHKKRGLGKGKINAPGGRIDSGETAEQAAIRECTEEVSVTPSGLVLVGVLNFIFADGYSLKGYVFFSKQFTGEPKESDEADPFWCKKAEIPFEKMWADDIHWLPPVLSGKTICGRFCFDNDTMLSNSLDITGTWSY